MNPETQQDADGRRTPPSGSPVFWTLGNTPDIAEGTKRRFIVSRRSDRGKIFHFELIYLNRFAMPCGDCCEPPDNAEPVDPDDPEEYYWTGWHTDHCSVCDEVSWAYHGWEQIIAFTPTPVFPENAKCGGPGISDVDAELENKHGR